MKRSLNSLYRTAPFVDLDGWRAAGRRGAQRAILWACVLAGAVSVMAETVIVESRLTGGTLNDNPPYGEADGNWQNSSVKSSAAGLSGTGSRWNTTAGSSVTITPTLETPGGTYLVEVTFPGPNSQTADIVVSITQENCTGLPETTTAFQRAGANTWKRVGTLVLNPGQTTPIIKFTHQSGALSATAGRFYFDSIRFINASDPCLSGLPQLTTVNGPLGAGQTYVNVPNISSNATKVTVYADGVQIGQKASDIVAGVNTVTTSPLEKGKAITVTQSDASNVESCRPSTGPLVGGGPNPAIRVALSIKENTALTGPIGTNGGTATLPLKMLGAVGPTSGFGTAPAGDKIFQPSTCWQTVTLLRGEDPANPTDTSYIWSGSGGNQINGDFGILDAIAFSIEDTTDSGPYLIYIDNFMNGSTLIQDFESTPAGTNALFMQPAFSGTTSPFLLSQAPGTISPNLTTVTNSNADTGTNSLMVTWQFKDTQAGNWLRLVAQGPGTPNPVIDLRLPISFRLLLLPAGSTTNTLTVSKLADRTNAIGDNVTFQVSAVGAGAITYQWRFNGTDLAGKTGDKLTLSNVQTNQAGEYSVAVSSDAGCSAISGALLTVTETKPPPGPLTIARNGNTAVLTWEGAFILQSSASLSGSYSDVAGAVNGHNVENISATPQMFYRLRN